MAKLYEVTYAPYSYSTNRKTTAVVANTVVQVVEYMAKFFRRSCQSGGRVTQISEIKDVSIGVR
jgi:hypothetical protein